MMHEKEVEGGRLFKKPCFKTTEQSFLFQDFKRILKIGENALSLLINLHSISFEFTY